MSVLAIAGALTRDATTGFRTRGRFIAQKKLLVKILRFELTPLLMPRSLIDGLLLETQLVFASTESST